MSAMLSRLSGGGGFVNGDTTLLALVYYSTIAFEDTYRAYKHTWRVAAAGSRPRAWIGRGRGKRLLVVSSA